MVGRNLDGRYRLAHMIHLGGMGAIFRAEQLSTGREVAVKVLKPAKSEDPDLVRRFEREAEVLERLSHPNIVTLIDAGRGAGGISYLAMERVGGATLRDALENGSLSLLEIVSVFSDAASALAEVHAEEVVHRDLKFENIMVSRQADGRLRVTVLDFGVAKPMWEDRAFDVTRKREVPGTPSVVAPELVGEGDPTPQSDLYSLGVMFYTALAGEEPFEAVHDLELMRAHKQEPVPDLGARAATYVPESLIELTERLLEKDPRQRPPSATAVRDRLESVRHLLWESPLDNYAYEPGDEGSEELREVVSSVVRDSSDETGKIPDWLRSVFGSGA